MYAERCETPSDIFEHLPKMVALVEALNAQHVIELGSRTGVSTVAWLYALESTGGRLTSVDLDCGPQIGTWGHWEHIQGDDCSPEVLEQLEPADIVFIDSSHHFGHTCHELAIYRWLVKPGGVICLHDTELRYPEGTAPPDPSFPVKKAVREFVAENGFDWINYTECYGFAVVRGF
jgi:predicted O-methyltransferase YrrM